MSWKLVVVMMSFSDTGAASTSLATIPDIRQEQACRALETELSTDYPSEQLGHKYVIKSKATCVEDPAPVPAPVAAPRPRPSQPAQAASPPSAPPVAPVPSSPRPAQVERYDPRGERYDPYRDSYYPRGARVPGQFDE